MDWGRRRTTWDVLALSVGWLFSFQFRLEALQKISRSQAREAFSGWVDTLQPLPSPVFAQPLARSSAVYPGVCYIEFGKEP